MRPNSGTIAAILVVVVLMATCVPARADDGSKPKRSAATIVKWTLIGAAAGAGIGFLTGFNVYDQATYSERKTTVLTIISGAIGAGAGLVIGYHRAAVKSGPTRAAFRQWELSRTPVAHSADYERPVHAIVNGHSTSS